MFRSKSPQFKVPVAKRVRDLEIVSARLIRAGFAGDYHSAFHGRGIEFSQVREYQPGDDIRTIDWNVTARTGAPHVKEFIEERDLTVIVALDVSGSMGFGSVDWRKCDIAAELAAVKDMGLVAVEIASNVVGRSLHDDSFEDFWSEAERLRGFELGVDDYVVKPFSPAELVARVRAVLRRARPAGRASAPAFDDGVLKIDGEVGNKKAYDPRSYLKAGEKGMAKRIKEACDDLKSSGKTLFSA